jgi:hypothetical protein
MPDTTQPDPSISTELIIPQEVLPSLNIDVEGLDRVIKVTTEKALSRAQTDLEREEVDFKDHEDSLKRSIRRVIRARKEVQNLKNQIEEKADYASLLKHLSGMVAAGNYTRFAIEDSRTIVGFTTDIAIKDKGVKYLLGQLKVAIRVDCLAVKVTRHQNNPEFFPGNYPDVLNPHPHVQDTGDVCWGNVSSDIPIMIANGNLGGVFEIAYDFLHHYNHGGEYRPLRHWPEVKEEKPKRVPKPRVSKQPAIPISSSNEQVVVDGEIGMVESVVMPMVAPVSDSTDLTIAIDNDIRIHGIDPYNLSLTEKIRVHESLERHERGSESYVRALA